MSNDEFGTQPQGVIWIIGHPGHGKTTLKAALARHPSNAGAAQRFVEIEGGSADHGGAQIAILVVSAAEGPMPQTRDHLNLAKRVGVRRVVIFMNKMDVADKDLTELVEMEMRQLLTMCGFAGDKADIVRGSAAKALEGDASWIGEPSIDRLMRVLGGSSAAPDSGGGFFRRLFG